MKELLKQDDKVQKSKAVVALQQEQIEALIVGFQKVNAQIVTITKL